MQNLSAPFIFQEECRMKIEHVLFPSVFSDLQTRVLEGHFYCVRSHDLIFGTNKNRILKNGSCEQALRVSSITPLLYFLRYDHFIFISLYIKVSS